MRTVKFESKEQKQIIKDFCASRNCNLRAFVKLLEALGIAFPTEIREVQVNGRDILFQNGNEKFRISGDILMVYREKGGIKTVYIVSRFSNAQVLAEEWYSEP